MYFLIPLLAYFDPHLLIETKPETSIIQKAELDATIPVVDLNEFYQSKETFIAKLSDALKEVGFFAVINTGVDSKTLDDAYDAAERFFRLNSSQKFQIYDAKLNGQRGYVPGETAKGQTDGDYKEFLHITRNWTPEQIEKYQMIPNIWPTQFDLENPMMKLFAALEEHLEPLQQAIALSINQPADFLNEMTREGNCLLRALHYPSNPPANRIWAGEHTDTDLLSILPRATADGLQVLNKNGEWIDVRVPENSFIVNAGDYLENMTNGLYKSCKHRVVDNGKGQERFSMVLFIHPRADDKMDPLPQCIALTGGVQKYANATGMELLMERLVDLDLASSQMVQDLADSGLMERLDKVGRASPKALEKVRELRKS